MLVCVPLGLVPILCGTLHTLELREAWATDADWVQGYTWITTLQAELMSGCVDRIVESNDRIYRLLDTALNGTAYTATPAESPVPDPVPDPTKPIILPALPDVPDAGSPALLPIYAIRYRIEQLILEQRALRGGDVITADIRDTMSDPFGLPLETVGAVKNGVDGTNQRLDTANLKLQGIIDALNADSLDLESIINSVGLIVGLLG